MYWQRESHELENNDTRKCVIHLRRGADQDQRTIRLSLIVVRILRNTVKPIVASLVVVVHSYCIARTMHLDAGGIFLLWFSCAWNYVLRAAPARADPLPRRALHDEAHTAAPLAAAEADRALRPSLHLGCVLAGRAQLAPGTGRVTRGLQDHCRRPDLAGGAHRRGGARRASRLRSPAHGSRW